MEVFSDEPTIVFDTDCMLCSGIVHFILRHESDQSIRFVSAWSEAGIALAASHDLTKGDLDRTFLFVEHGVGLTRSDAALAISDHLRWPWRAISMFRVIPRALRDLVYNLVARHRYRWFGRLDGCFVVPSQQRHRFIDATG